MLYLTCIAGFYVGTRSVLTGMISIPMGMFYIPTGGMYIPAGMICIPAGIIRNKIRARDTSHQLINFFINRSEFLTCKNFFLPSPEFSPAWQIFNQRAQFFIVAIYVCPRANWEMVTNNLTAVIDVALCEALRYLLMSTIHYQGE